MTAELEVAILPVERAAAARARCACCGAWARPNPAEPGSLEAWVRVRRGALVATYRSSHWERRHAGGSA